MRINALFVLLMFACLYVTLAQGSYEDCCLKYVKDVKKGLLPRVVKYRRQIADGSCNIPAIVFTMRKGHNFCANPDAKWVRELMKKIDMKKIPIRKPHHPRQKPEGHRLRY